ncbi:MAG: hypothetical protein GY699_14695 [Desulfobacteraceae bacterium]|nr:hypothetical protein [Desulfobacteraceae bacterium]
MKLTINLIKNLPGFILFALMMMIFTSISSAQDIEYQPDQNFVVLANILAISANIDPESMAISYNGISNNSDTFNTKQSLSQSSMKTIKSANSSDFGGKLKPITDTFYNVFNLDSFSSNDDSDSRFLVKSKINADKRNTKDVEFKFSLVFGGNDDTILKMDGVKLESSWKNTYFNAVYHYEKSEIELSMTNSNVNDYLFDGMRLEVQANPSANAGAILLIMNF